LRPDGDAGEVPVFRPSMGGSSQTATWAPDGAAARVFSRAPKPAARAASSPRGGCSFGAPQRRGCRARVSVFIQSTSFSTEDGWDGMWPLARRGRGLACARGRRDCPLPIHGRARPAGRVDDNESGLVTSTASWSSRRAGSSQRGSTRRSERSRKKLDSA